MDTIGFIGMGNMAQAMACGFINSGKVKAEEVFAYAPNQARLKENASKIGFIPASSNLELVKKSKIIFVACKPYQIADVLKEVKEELEGKVLVSVAAGWTFDTFAEHIDVQKVHVQCVMPNTPAKIGQGVMLVEQKNSLSAEESATVLGLLGTLGITETLPTNLMGIGGAISGCSPAFMDLIIEAYADAAVKYGMQRAQAYRLVSKTMAGSAMLQLATGEHPGVLKDAVCSPGGTTIRGVDALEKSGLRAACINSIDAIMNKK